MFVYFGYGSNINLISLRAKGVVPVASERGVLRGWSLRFNVKHWFRHEGGVGNVQFTGRPDDYVEGMVHTCRDEHLAPLDAVEAYRVGYDRIVVDVETNHGHVKAYTYVGLPGYLDDSCLPTRRYLNIIIRGAEAAGLSPAYIEKLKRQPVFPEQVYPDFVFPEGIEEVFDKASLAAHPYLTALGGAVFDMRGARSELDCLHDLFGGKDTTLFHLKRLDTSDGKETPEDIRAGRFSEHARKYLNAYLHEYAREFRYIGRYVDSV
jgi:hypothetical protein